MNEPPTLIDGPDAIGVAVVNESGAGSIIHDGALACVDPGLDGIGMDILVWFGFPAVYLVDFDAQVDQDICEIAAGGAIEWIDDDPHMRRPNRFGIDGILERIDIRRHDIHLTIGILESQGLRGDRGFQRLDKVLVGCGGNP